MILKQTGGPRGPLGVTLLHVVLPNCRIITRKTGDESSQISNPLLRATQGDKIPILLLNLLTMASIGVSSSTEKSLSSLLLPLIFTHVKLALEKLETSIYIFRPCFFLPKFIRNTEECPSCCISSVRRKKYSLALGSINILRIRENNGPGHILIINTRGGPRI